MIEGIELETAWVGPPLTDEWKRPVLVFLHEGLGSITQWRDTPAQIATRAGLPGFIYARQGYGKSTPVRVPRPLTYMHDEAERLPVVLAAAGIESSILVGHSDGASIAIIAAETAVIIPHALVLIAPHVFVEEISITSIAAAADAYRDGELRAKLARHHADVDGAFWGWNRAWLDPEFRKWNLVALLPQITQPTLIVQGLNDKYGTRAQVDAIAHGIRGPVEIELVERAGHTPFRDAPEQVHARIANFVAGIR